MMTRIAAGSGSTFARIALLFMLGGLLQACSVVDWVKGIGSGSSSEEKEALKPAPLVDFSAETELYKVWSAGVGNGQGKEYNRLQVALDGTTIFAASADGTVAAFDAATGKRRWRIDVDAGLSGGVGVGGDLVLAGDTAGNVIALESASGHELWRARVSSEVLAAPAAYWDVVVVHTLDGNINGFDARTGARLADLRLEGQEGEEILEVEAGAAEPGREVREAEREALRHAVDLADPALGGRPAPEPFAEQVALEEVRRRDRVVRSALVLGELLHQREDERDVGAGRIADRDAGHQGLRRSS
ncbi:MAG TPA: PQQ-binding-like beta-propeller repeat protein, partial [Pseudomonadales bacterium]|nr:PQQ-binding-like beta-propeller repeat protein [Pseudomonadales bacterium]